MSATTASASPFLADMVTMSGAKPGRSTLSTCSWSEVLTRMGGLAPGAGERRPGSRTVVTSALQGGVGKVALDTCGETEGGKVQYIIARRRRGCGINRCNKKRDGWVLVEYERHGYMCLLKRAKLVPANVGEENSEVAEFQGNAFIRMECCLRWRCASRPCLCRTAVMMHQ